jgi:hypothetical protein
VTAVDAAAHAHSHVLAAGAPSLLEARAPRDYHLVPPTELVQELRCGRAAGGEDGLGEKRRQRGRRQRGGGAAAAAPQSLKRGAPAPSPTPLSRTATARPYDAAASAAAYFGRHFPAAAVPHALLEGLLLEAASPAAAAAEGALAGCRVAAAGGGGGGGPAGALLVFTAEGRAGELVALTALAPPQAPAASGGGGGGGSDDEEGGGAAPAERLVAAACGAADCGAPVLQLAARTAPDSVAGAPDAATGGLPAAAAAARPVLLLARCAYKLCLIAAVPVPAPPAGKAAPGGSGASGGAAAPPRGGWRAALLGEARLPRRVAHVCWSPHLLEAAAVCEDGGVWALAPPPPLLRERLAAASAGGGAGSLDWLRAELLAGGGALRLGRALGGGGRVAATFGAHPRALLVACGRRLVRLDLAACRRQQQEAGAGGGGGDGAGGTAAERLATLPRGEAFTALATWDAGGGLVGGDGGAAAAAAGQLAAPARALAGQLLAAATTQRLLLVDQRAPQAPLLAWDHGMGPDPPGALQLLPAPPAPPPRAPQVDGGGGGPEGLASPGDGPAWRASQMPSQLWGDSQWPGPSQAGAGGEWGHLPATQASQAAWGGFGGGGAPPPTSPAGAGSGGRSGGGGGEGGQQQELSGMLVCAGLALGQVLAASFTAAPGPAADRQGAAAAPPFAGAPAGWRLSCAATARAAGPPRALGGGGGARGLARVAEAMGRLAPLRRARALAYDCPLRCGGYVGAWRCTASRQGWMTGAYPLPPPRLPRSHAHVLRAPLC